MTRHPVIGHPVIEYSMTRHPVIELVEITSRGDN
jgi:hypothetical protein